jgi:addiction module RelE/StbE family toxin
MEKYKIELSKDARNDYFDIIRYIKYSLEEPTIADKYAELIEKEIRKLEYTPQRFAIISSDIIKLKNIRKLIIKNYIVFYRINENKKIVNIERILYGPSNWKDII